MKRITILLSMLILPMLLFSQFRITGIVTDKLTNHGLSGAHIVIKESFNTSYTDLNGKFQIPNLRAGTYSITASFIGYKTVQKIIKVSSDATITFEMDINPVLHDEVIISSTRVEANTPTTYKNIDKEEIAESNLGQDLPYLMEMHPSTIVSSDAGAGVGYTSFRIRGTDMTRINVTVNGIPLNDPESQGVFWVNMPDFASSIENIQIQRGVGTSTNGAAAFGASINLQTMALKADPYAEINSSAGSFNTFKNNLNFGTGLIDGKFSVDGRISKISSDGFVDRAFSDLKSYFLSAGYYGKNSIIKFNIFSGKEHTYQSWYGIPKDSLETNRTYNPYTYENETDNYQQDHYQLLYSQNINSSLLFNAAIHYTRGLGYYEQYKEDRDFADYQLQNVMIGGDTLSSTNLIQQKYLDNHFYGFTYSLKYNKKKIKAIIGGGWNKFLNDHYGNIIWAQYASNGAINHQWYFNDGTKTDFNVFGKLTYEINKKMFAYGDVQYRNVSYIMSGIHDDLRDISQTHDFNFINPKAGLFYHINNNSTAYVSVAISNREPNRSNYRDADEDYEPQAEKLVDYELGYSINGSYFAFTANAFYMDYTDQLVMTGEINNVGAAIMANVPESYRAGIELSGGIKISEQLKWDLNATFSQNKVKNFIAYVDNWTEPWGQIEENLGTTDLSFSPNIIAANMIKYEPIKNLKFALTSKYVSRQFIDNSSNEYRSLDPYFVSNININYTFQTSFVREIELKLMVNNIFNEAYETNAWVYRYYSEGQDYVMDGYFPQAGTNFLAGVTFRF